MLWRRLYSKKVDLTGAVNLISKSAAEATLGTRHKLAKSLFDNTVGSDSLSSHLGPALDFEPRNTAIDKLPTQIRPHVSPVLQLVSKNPGILHTETALALPPALARRFEPLPELRYQFVKARDPQSLRFASAYYFLFGSAEDAAVYFLETRRATLDGLPLQLRFVQPKGAYEQIFPPLIPIRSERTPEGTVERDCVAILRQLPYNITKDALMDELWDFDLYPSGELAVVELANDTSTKSRGSDWVVMFSNPQDAERCVRKYNIYPFDRSNPRLRVRAELL